MPLKFNCTRCEKELVVKYLKTGEEAKCHHCGADVYVPENAISINELTTSEKSSDLYIGQTITENKPLPPLTPEESERVLREFSKIRYRGIITLIILLVPFFALLFSIILGFHSAYKYTILIFFIFLGGFVFSSIDSRCPRCNRHLSKGSSPDFCDLCGAKRLDSSKCVCGGSFSRRGTNINYCRHCGARLRKL